MSRWHSAPASTSLRSIVGERPGVDADLDEAGADARALDPVAGLRRPAGRQLPGGLRVRVLRHRDVVRRAVVAGVRHDVEAARLREAAEEQRVPPEVGGRALEERLGSPASAAPARRGRIDAERLVGVVAGPARPSRPRRSPRARARGRASRPSRRRRSARGRCGSCRRRARAPARAGASRREGGPAAPASAREEGRDARTAQAFFRTSFSKSQETGALRLIDSFTMWATAAAWWPAAPVLDRRLARPHRVEEAGHVDVGGVRPDLRPRLAPAPHLRRPGVRPLLLLDLGVGPVRLLELRRPRRDDPAVALDDVLGREDHPVVAEDERALVAEDREPALARRRRC